MDIPSNHLVLGDDGLPTAPQGRDVVLHTRVVTEQGGGPDKTILLSSPFLADTNYWLAAAYMHPPEDKGFDVLQKRAASWNSPLISVPDRGPFDRKVLARMLQLCKKYQVKIWHGHDYKSNLVGLLLRPFYKMKLVTTVHGWVKHTFKTPLYYAVDRWTLPWYHHVICVSEDLHERALKLSVPEDRCSLVHNAIDENMFKRQHAPAEAELRKQMNTPANRLVIGAVGRLSAEKGFNLLIQAAAKLIGEGHDIELWIAGDGDAKPELEKLIAQLKVGDRVKLLGFVSDTVGLYHAMDLFCLSSLREGLPNVVLEAMSMGVPVVSTKVAGVPKMITDGENGLLVDIGDADLLTDALRKSVRDPGMRNHLATQGRSLIEKEYSFTRRMEKVKAIYDRVLGIEEPATHQSRETPGPKVLEAVKA
ncbi:MAG: glycosyltransferase [Phycisphaeraceae bacterium]